MRRAKAAAALEGKTLRTILTEAVVQALDHRGEKNRAVRRVSLPLVPSKRPGTLQLDSDNIAAVLNQEDNHALAGH
jgi:hypothetical protein